MWLEKNSIGTDILDFIHIVPLYEVMESFFDK